MAKHQCLTWPQAVSASRREVLHGGLLLIAALFLLTPPPTLGGNGNMMLILDASGSMWGQLDGRAKIEIAREVMAGLVKDLPADLNVGLVAYGHRRKGDCSDVEQIAPLGPLDKPSLTAQIQRLSPKGKTPLSNSVREVARSLQHLEDETTILLVSDGKETCGGDPCALVRELKQAGIKFVLHVVGFDVNAAERWQLQCMAEAGGGTYYTAANASEFQQAVQDIQRTGQLKIVALRNGTPILAQVQVTAASGEVTSGQTTAARSQPVAFKLDAGRYRVTVTDPAIPGLAPVVFDAVEIGGGAVVERVAAFAPAQLRLTATKNGRPTGATYQVTPSGQSSTLATATVAEPQAFWLAPGSVDIAITESGVEQPETVRFTAVTLSAGQTVERTADFSAGRLRIHATRNGQPIKARVEVLVPDEERDAGSFHTSTDPKRPAELELKPGVYTAVVTDESGAAKAEVVLANLEIKKGTTVEQSADFSDGTLQLIALRNGQLIPAAVEVIPQDSAQALAADTSTMALDKPLRLTLPLGTYRLRVTDTENPARPTIELSGVEVRAGKANEQVAEFRAAIIDLKAVKNKQPVAALASLTPLPDKPKQTVLLSATEQPRRLFLEPGRFDLLVRHGQAEEERTAEFQGIVIALGDTVEKVADFSDGVLIVKATRNGEPYSADLDIYKAPYKHGDDQYRDSNAGNRVTLPPGLYDINVEFPEGEV
jgi:Ca-activated chloride channel family protein